MALKIVKNINVDFYDNKYILISAKQYDDSSRWITITCYNQGDIFSLSASKHSAYVRCKKADGNSTLNSCKINRSGEVLVELTEQMLAANGICYVDLVIINKGSAMVDIDTGEIIAIDDAPILSTMAFCISVYESPVDNSEFESSYEYNAFNDLIQKAEAEYTEVINLSKSYAVGGTGIRDGEDTDNSKFYSEQSKLNALKCDVNADKAKSYAVGGTGTREGEDSDNAHYYYSLTKSIVNGLNSGFIPMGTISFSELATVEKAVGFSYNINENFKTDDTFREGADKFYNAGTNVYYTADGYWDCFGGAATQIATVAEVKDFLGI